MSYNPYDDPELMVRIQKIKLKIIVFIVIFIIYLRFK